MTTRPDIFYPGKSRMQVDAVEVFCFDCPVRRDCDNGAKLRDERYGIWGGRQRRRAAATVTPEEEKKDAS